MEEEMKYFYFVLAGLCALFCTVCSCSTEEAAAQILGSSSEAPIFLSCRAVSDREIDFEFSRPVKVLSLNFSPVIAVESVENGSVIRVNFDQGPGPGERLVADLLVEDENGNTINVLVPLRTRNTRVPALLINELRTEYSKPKVEFIEFRALEAGNLGALRVFIAGNYKAPLVYEFSPVEVQSGEYIVLHLRTVEEACRDELGARLDESGGTESSPTARDLWLPGNVKLLHKTDAIYVLDQDDGVLDSVMIAEVSEPWWNKEYLADAADFLFRKGAWKTADEKICGPDNAVNAGTTTLTRTICRDESTANTNTAAAWYVTVNSGATPGKPNNPNRYVPK
jgi:hypothetical protein